MSSSERRALVALLTDFGVSEYVGVMKGIILDLCPRAVLVDLCHAVPPQDVRQGAWLLLANYHHFPAGTIFLCVVDPGVGTERQPVAVRTRRYQWVGPDNGLLWPAVHDDGAAWAVRLAVPENASPTFHGRDVFAPATARLAAGARLEALGAPARLTVPLTFHRHGREGEIVRIDSFGNAVTNLPPLPDRRRYAADGARLPPELPWFANYAQAPPETLFLVIGSAGTLELSVKNGSAAERCSLRASVRLRLA